MIAYKRIVTIRDSKELVLHNLPFSPGQRVEVLLLAEDTTSSTPPQMLSDLEALFRETQALPQVQAISEEEIALEIAAYRAGHESAD